MAEPTFPQDRTEAEPRRQKQANESGKGKETPGIDEHEAGGSGLSG